MQQVRAGHRLGGHEVEQGADDDSTLPEAAECRIEQVAIGRGRAANEVARPRDDRQLAHAIHDRPLIVAERAAANRQHATDRQARVAAQPRTAQALRERRLDDVTPEPVGKRWR